MEIKEKSTNHYTLADDRPEARDEGLLTFIWNSKTGEVLGRSGMSWAKITLFYIIFYICLAIFVFVCYNIFAATTLIEGEPRWKLTSSLIGANPGVGFRPMPDQDKNTDSSLIWINLAEEKTDSYWVDELDEFFKGDKPKAEGLDCNFQNGVTAGNGEFCNLDTSKVPVCTRGNNGYGYFEGKPCVLIKLNKIYDFVPKAYTKDTLKQATDQKMPASLRSKIESYANSPATSNLTRSTWISCEGENPSDKETIGPLAYYSPGREKFEFEGIPNYYYPYQNQEGYKTPFLFVKFMNPRPNTLIQVECKAWAENIQYDRTQRLGSVHFELLIDTK